MASMNRKGNCHDSTCAESFSGLLKRERIRRKFYPTSEAAKSDMFNYIELSHGHNDNVSPKVFEGNYFKELASV